MSARSEELFQPLAERFRIESMVGAEDRAARGTAPGEETGHEGADRLLGAFHPELVPLAHAKKIQVTTRNVGISTGTV